MRPWNDLVRLLLATHTESELRRLPDHVQGWTPEERANVTDYLPGADTEMADLAHTFVRRLQLLQLADDAFFDTVIEHRPRSADAIEAIREALRSSPEDDHRSNWESRHLNIVVENCTNSEMRNMARQLRVALGLLPQELHVTLRLVILEGERRSLLRAFEEGVGRSAELVDETEALRASDAALSLGGTRERMGVLHRRYRRSPHRRPWLPLPHAGAYSEATLQNLGESVYGPTTSALSARTLRQFQAQRSASALGNALTEILSYQPRNALGHDELGDLVADLADDVNPDHPRGLFDLFRVVARRVPPVAAFMVLVRRSAVLLGAALLLVVISATSLGTVTAIFLEPSWSIPLISLVPERSGVRTIVEGSRAAGVIDADEQERALFHEAYAGVHDEEDAELISEEIRGTVNFYPKPLNQDLPRSLTVVQWSVATQVGLDAKLLVYDFTNTAPHELRGVNLQVVSVSTQQEKEGDRSPKQMCFDVMPNGEMKRRFANPAELGPEQTKGVVYDVGSKFEGGQPIATEEPPDEPHDTKPRALACLSLYPNCTGANGQPQSCDVPTGPGLAWTLSPSSSAGQGEYIVRVGVDGDRSSITRFVPLLGPEHGPDSNSFVPKGAKPFLLGSSWWKGGIIVREPANPIVDQLQSNDLPDTFEKWLGKIVATFKPTCTFDQTLDDFTQWNEASTDEPALGTFVEKSRISFTPATGACEAKGSMTFSKPETALGRAQGLRYVVAMGRPPMQ